MFRNVPNLVQEHVTAQPLLHQGGEVMGSAARNCPIIVQDAQTQQHSRQTMTQPLCLIMLIRTNLGAKILDFTSPTTFMSLGLQGSLAAKNYIHGVVHT